MKKTKVLPLFALAGMNLVGCAGGGSTPSVVDEDGVLVIGENEGVAKFNGVSNAENATNIVIPSTYNDSKLRYIKPGALAGCKRLKSLTIPFVGLYAAPQQEGDQVQGKAIASTTTSTKIDADGNAQPQAAEGIIAYSENSFGSIFGDEYYEGSTLVNQDFEEIAYSDLNSYYSEINSYYDYQDYYETSYVDEDYEGTTSMIISEIASGFSGAILSLKSVTSALPMQKEGVASLDNLIYHEGTGVDFVNHAFKELKSVGNYYLPNTLEEITITGGEIHSGSFAGLTNLKRVKIGADVTSIEPYAFASCINLESVTIDPKCKIVEIGEGAFSNCMRLTKISIPNSVDRIGDFAFYNCQNLTDVSFKGLQPLQSSLTKIGDYSFAKTAIKSFTAPSSLNYIGEGAFAENGSLKSFDGDNVLFIDDYAFYYCFNLKSASLKKVASIGELAFGDCASLEEVVINNDVNYTSEEMEFLSVLHNHAPFSVKDRAFYNCVSLDDVVIPSRINFIGEATFKNCTNLYTVEFYEPGDVKSLNMIDRFDSGLSFIGEKAFKNTGLGFVTLPSTVTYIGANTFENCDNLSYVSMNTTATSNLYYVGRRVFYNCPSLISVSLPACSTASSDNLGVFGPYAFKNDTSLRNVTVPAGVNTIWAGCFENCSSLESVTLNEGVRFIFSDAFKNCTSLKEITIPSTVVYIETGAFRNCKNLETVNFADNSMLGLRYGSGLMKKNTAKDSAFDARLDILNGYGYKGSYYYREGVESPFLGCSSLKKIHFGKDCGFKDLTRNFFAGTEECLQEVIYDGYTSNNIGFGDHEFEVYDEPYLEPDISTKTLKMRFVGLNYFNIGAKTFAGFKQLKNVVLPRLVNSECSAYYLGDFVNIESNAFEGVTTISQIDIPAPFHAFGDYSDYYVEWDYKYYLLKNDDSHLGQVIAQNAFKGWNANQTIYIHDDVNYPSIYWEVATENDGVFFHYDPWYDQAYENKGFDFDDGWGLDDLTVSSDTDHIYKSGYWGSANIKFDHKLEKINKYATLTVNQLYKEQISSRGGECQYTDLDGNNYNTFVRRVDYDDPYKLVYTTPTGPRVTEKGYVYAPIKHEFMYDVVYDSELDKKLAKAAEAKSFTTVIEVKAGDTALTELTHYAVVYAAGDASNPSTIKIVFETAKGHTIPDSDLTVTIK